MIPYLTTQYLHPLSQIHVPRSHNIAGQLGAIIEVAQRYVLRLGCRIGVRRLWGTPLRVKELNNYVQKQD
jgi:hypothetical protein